jgi:regulator of cell morphogenesis and NO signaling
MERYTRTNNMRELIRDNAGLLPVISRFDIAFGFGDSPLAEVCKNNKVDADTFLNVCNFLSGYPCDVDRISLRSLMDYLKRAHSSFLDVSMPGIRHQLIEAIHCCDANEIGLLLVRFFDDYVEEVKSHMEYENDVVFKYVEHLLDNDVDCGFEIRKFSVNHGHMAEKLNELKDIFIYHYKQKENARLSAVLFDIIMCERDLMSHFEVESKLFIPAVEKLETALRNNPECASDNHARQVDAENQQSDCLSGREKDVVRGVALGKSNKEIADMLFISVHTVTTHRKNISAKLGIHSPAGLAIYAILHNIVDINEVTPA